MKAPERTQDGNEDGCGEGEGMETGTGVETREITQDGNRDGNENENDSSSGDGTGDGNEDGIGEDGGEPKKRNKPHKCCRRDVVNGGNLGGNIETKCRKRSVGSVTADPDDLEDSKEAGREAQGTQGLSNKCTSKESVFPLSRRIRGFRNKYH